jgi:hypothetical protein
MSSTEDSGSLKARQVETVDNLQLSETDSSVGKYAHISEQQEEYYRIGCVALKLSCTVLNLIIMAVTEACARNWGGRLEMMSQSAWLPDRGYGDINAVAAQMNMKVSGARKMVKKLKDIPRNKPGRIMYRFEDIVRMAPYADTDEAEGDEE